MCPCHSLKPYDDCCKQYHHGTLPENALLLMRSRYAAYALGLADYIINTTHPTHLQFTQDRAQWKKEILQFSKRTSFTGLEINEFIDGEHTASVTFTAYLAQDGHDVSFSEKSTFIREGEKWLYASGEILS